MTGAGAYDVFMLDIFVKGTSVVYDTFDAFVMRFVLLCGAAAYVIFDIPDALDICDVFMTFVMRFVLLCGAAVVYDVFDMLDALEMKGATVVYIS